MTVIQSALNFAAKEGTISKTDVPKLSKPERTYREGFGQRPFKLEEMRAIFAAAKSENERKMLLVWASTVCRPGQILDLTGDRIDLDENSIEFRVPDAVISKKRRAKVMMCPSVHAYLAPRWEPGLLVYNTTKVEGTKLKGFTPEGETWRYIEADLPPAVRVLEAMLKEISPPWLSFAGDSLVSHVKHLFSLVAANDGE